MRKEKRSSKRKKRLLLLSFPILLILFGVWFSGTNAATFLEGYMLFQADQAKADDVPQKPEISIPEDADPPEDKEVLYPVRPVIGENIGELYIPKLEARLPIFHGTDEEELAKGVGHFAGSVLPGEEDNSVLSGHRDTVFRKLGEVGKGDLLTVETAAGKFTYKVRRTRIVDADDRTVIVPKPNAVLTVSTCYPFDFIGPAPERYILIAELISSELK